MLDLAYATLYLQEVTVQGGPPVYMVLSEKSLRGNELKLPLLGGSRRRM